MNFFQFASRNQGNLPQTQQNQQQQTQNQPIIGQRQFTGIHFTQKQLNNPPTSSVSFVQNQQIQTNSQNQYNINEKQQIQNQIPSSPRTNSQQSNYSNPLDALDSLENDLKILSIWANQQEALLVKMVDDAKALDQTLESKLQQFN